MSAIEYQRVRKKILKFLGGKCVKCGTAASLEIDHKDHLKKNFSISAYWYWRWNRLLPELMKCQLLCRKHHREKTHKEKSQAKGWNKIKRVQHGTASYYTTYGCRCDPCRKAKSEHAKRYRNNR